MKFNLLIIIFLLFSFSVCLSDEIDDLENKAADFYKSGLYKKSEKTFLNVIDKTKNKYGENNIITYQRYVKMGDFYNYRKSILDSENYYNLAEKVLTKIKIEDNIKVSLYHKLFLLHSDNEYYKKSFEYYEKALKIYKSHEMYDKQNEIQNLYLSIKNKYENENEKTSEIANEIAVQKKIDIYKKKSIISKELAEKEVKAEVKLSAKERLRRHNIASSMVFPNIRTDEDIKLFLPIIRLNEEKTRKLEKEVEEERN